MKAVVEVVLKLLLINGFLINIINCHLRSEDLEVAGHLSRQLGARYYVVLDDGYDLELVKRMRESIGGGLYYTVMNSPLLEKMLEKNASQFEFFQARTAIITKEDLNFTRLLEKVLLPGYLVWILFRPYDGTLYVPVSCHVVFVDWNQGVVTAQHVYHLKPAFGETRGKLWMWTPGEGMKPPFALEYKMNDFHNVSMDMLVVYMRDFCVSMKNLTLTKKISCVQQDLLEMLGQRLNFSVNVVECMEKEYPYSYPNGTESELYRKLRLREVDFSITSHLMTRRNFYRMDYVWPTFVLKSMMYIKPGELAGRWGSYLRPLESSVWWGMFSWILLTGILTIIFERSLTHSITFNLSLITDLISSTFKALQLFCNQSLSEIPSSYSLRIVYFFTLFLVLIFFQAYCGYLASSLTVVVSRFPFTDLNGFFENGEYRMMTLKRGFHKYYFKKIVGAERQEDFMLDDEDLPVTVDDAVQKLCSGGFLAFTEFREDLLSIDKLRCKIAELPKPVLTLYGAIGSPRNSPYREIANRELMYLRSTGILKRLGSHLTAHSDFLDKGSREDYVTVSFSQIFSIFILLGLGVLLSIFVLALEILLEKYKKPPLSTLRRVKKSFRGSRIKIRGYGLIE